MIFEITWLLLFSSIWSMYRYPSLIFCISVDNLVGEREKTELICKLIA